MKEGVSFLRTPPPCLYFGADNHIKNALDLKKARRFICYPSCLTLKTKKKITIFHNFNKIMKTNTCFHQKQL